MGDDGVRGPESGDAIRGQQAVGSRTRRFCTTPVGIVSGGEDSEGSGAGDGFGAVGDAELAVGVGNMAFHGRQADEERVGDLLIAQPGRDQAKNFDFPGRQRLD